MPEEPLVVSISSSTSLNPDEIARRTFPATRKGVDGDVVRRYLESIADDVRMVLERESQLRRRLAEAERKAAEPPVLDEATLNQAVGAETARVLQSAHDAAREVVGHAEARAAELLTEAETQATERRAAAEEESTSLLDAAAEETAASAAAVLAETTALREGAEAEAQALIEAARADAVALLDTTKQRCRQAVREARQARKSVLSDLVEQRRGLFVQLEQLRSGRDSLVEVVAAVEVTVAELKGRLAGAEHDARMAAAVGGDRAEMVVDEEVDTLLEPDIALEMRAELLGEELDADADHIAATSDDVPGERGVVVGEEVLIEEDHDEQDEDDELERDTAASHRSVGELFARIRAARGSASDRGGDGDGPVTSGLEEISEAQRGTVAPGVDLTEVEDTAAVTAQVEDTAAVTAHVEDTAGVEVEVEDIADAVDAAEDIAAKLRRDELLTPVLTKLGRALKRALQDDQNELLNAIRHASGTPDLERMLPEDVQLERYAMAASGALADGWLLGRTWLHQAGEPGALADSVRVSKEATERGRILGIELADELAGLLRHRLSESLRALGELGEGAHDAAGAAYREWKGPRVEGIAGDFATRAFAGGAVAASEGTTVRWVVDDGWPCPDCDDNALAGEQLAGDVWPTGQAHPPVHPGCRCLLVASTH